MVLAMPTLAELTGILGDPSKRPLAALFLARPVQIPERCLDYQGQESSQEGGPGVHMVQGDGQGPGEAEDGHAAPREAGDSLSALHPNLPGHDRPLPI